MKSPSISQPELTRLAKIARTEGICVEISRGDTTIKLYPLDAKNTEETELDNALAEFDKRHGYR